MPSQGSGVIWCDEVSWRKKIRLREALPEVCRLIPRVLEATLEPEASIEIRVEWGP